MSLMRSTFQRVGIVASVLTLAVFGCPQQGAEQSDGSGTGLSPGADSGSGGGGGGGSDAGSGGGGNNSRGGFDPFDRTALVRSSSPTLFVADVDNGVASFANAHVLDGDVAATTFFDTFERLRVTINQGRGEQMNARGACVDRVGSLIILCRVEGELFLRFYNNAATVTGIPDADRQIRIGGTGDSPGEVAYDRGNDRLFVVVNESILIFEGAALAQNGDVAPTRSFSHPDLNGSIALGPNGDLYATAFGGVDGFGGILVFANAGLRSGPATPDRTISLLGHSESIVFVDSLDRLFVAEARNIAVLENASTRDGLIEFDAFPVIQLERLNAPGFTLLNSISALAVDSRGIGYVAVADDGDIHIFDNIATRSGLTRADRVIVYDSAIESGDPDAIFLWE